MNYVKIILFIMILLFSCRNSPEKNLKVEEKINNEMLALLKKKYATQYHLLLNPETWCEGANQLTKVNDDFAILLIIEVYLIPIEERKICLFKAMKKFESPELVKKLWNMDDAEIKKLTVHLIRLFPNQDYLNMLSEALQNNQGHDTAFLVKAFITQIRTSEWENAMLKSLHFVNTNQQQNILMELKKSKSQEIQQKIREWEMK